MRTAAIHDKYKDFFYTLPGVYATEAQEDAIYIHAIPSAELLAEVPLHVDGVPVFIRGTGKPVLLNSNQTRKRPVYGGLSVGALYIGNGTISTVYWSRRYKSPVIVSNTHVLSGEHNQSRKRESSNRVYLRVTGQGTDPGTPSFVDSPSWLEYCNLSLVEHTTPIKYFIDGEEGTQGKKVSYGASTYIYINGAGVPDKSRLHAIVDNEILPCTAVQSIPDPANCRAVFGPIPNTVVQGVVQVVLDGDKLPAIFPYVNTDTGTTNRTIGVFLAVLDKPQITSISHSECQTGTEITITGTGFGNRKGRGGVYLNERIVSTITAWNGNQVKFIVPDNAKTGFLWIETEGQPILQQGITDGGLNNLPATLIGELIDYIPMGGEADAAYCLPYNPDDTRIATQHKSDGSLVKLGPNISSPFVGQTLWKTGRTTETTSGNVLSIIGTTFGVPSFTCELFWYHGDSGSAVITTDGANSITGLAFASSYDYIHGYACFVHGFTNRFDVTLYKPLGDDDTTVGAQSPALFNATLMTEPEGGSQGDTVIEGSSATFIQVAAMDTVEGENIIIGEAPRMFTPMLADSEGGTVIIGNKAVFRQATVADFTLVQTTGTMGEANFTMRSIGPSHFLDGSISMQTNIIASLQQSHNVTAPIDLQTIIQPSLIQSHNISGNVSTITTIQGSLTVGEATQEINFVLQPYTPPLAGEEVNFTLVPVDAVQPTHEIDGTVATLTIIAGSLQQSHSVNGSAAFLTLIQGGLSQSHNISGSIAPKTTITGSLEVGDADPSTQPVHQISGEIRIITVIDGALSQGHSANGEITGRTYIVGEVKQSHVIDGSASVNVTIVGALGDLMFPSARRIVRLKGTLRTTAALSGTLKITERLAGTIREKIRLKGVL